MALQGTLRDFALPDILQLIGIQRKTGILTMEGEQDTVTVQFFQGQVVGADTRSRRLEDLLGSVLVRTGRISEAQLREALAVQRETLQRLGYILVRSGFISEDGLREALRVQINQIVYRLFRWRDGRYNFAPMDHLEYDRNLTIPVSAETVLMEAARMIDEWPMIEKRIRSPRMVFRKTAAGRAYEADAAGVDGSAEDFNLDMLGGTASCGKESPVQCSPEEHEILRKLDGRANVQDVVDQTSLGEFDAHRTLYELLKRDLIQEVTTPEAASAAAGGRTSALMVRASEAALAGVAILALLTAGFNDFAPWRIGSVYRESEALRGYVSRSRLERIEAAIQVHYLDTGSVPDRLDTLSESGYLRSTDLLDPWGRLYEYERSADGFRLLGRDGAGGESPALRILRSFNPNQRNLMEGLAHTSPGGGSTRP